MPVKLITDDITFSRVIDGDKLVLSFFFVPGCPKCRQLSPIFRKLSNIYTEAEFIKINCMEYPEISDLNEVMAFPTILFFEDKICLDQLIGGNACLLLKKLEALYGDTPLNIDGRVQKSVSMEFEAEGPEDINLGDHSHFLIQMKANCKRSNDMRRDLDEKVIAASALKLSAEETMHNSVSKPNIKESKYDVRNKQIDKYEPEQSSLAIPLLCRLANLQEISMTDVKAELNKSRMFQKEITSSEGVQSVQSHSVYKGSTTTQKSSYFLETSEKEGISQENGRQSTHHTSFAKESETTTRESDETNKPVLRKGESNRLYNSVDKEGTSKERKRPTTQQRPSPNKFEKKSNKSKTKVESKPIKSSRRISPIAGSIDYEGPQLKSPSKKL